MKDIKEITDKLEKGVQDIFNSAEYANYLAFMARFHKYSVNNSILIWLQKPDATLVAGYQTWLKGFKRQVRKGEKGITILAPCPRKYMLHTEDEDGNVIDRMIEYTAFKTTTVFDISQTDGEAVPENPCACKVLDGEITDFDGIMAKLKAVAPVPVEYEDIQTGALGYFHKDGKIAIKTGMSQTQTVKTLVHEIAHSLLHGKDGEQEKTDRETKEVQAESVAYTVCTVLGLDVSEYSFGYVAGWSTGREVKELTASMEVIRKTANVILEGLGAA